jgi:hypothetical protein
MGMEVKQYHDEKVQDGEKGDASGLRLLPASRSVRAHSSRHKQS